MKKLLALLAVCAVSIGFLAGCKSSKLPDSMDEQTVLDASHEIVEQLQAQDYKGIAANMNETMQKALTADQLAEVWDTYAEKLGDFTGYGKESVTGSDGYAVASVIAEFENGKVQFTISFDTDMKLAGFYVK